MVLNKRLVRFCRQTTQNTVQELQTYAWHAKAAQRGEEKPLKMHDHGPDAFRYFAKSEVPYCRNRIVMNPMLRHCHRSRGDFMLPRLFHSSVSRPVADPSAVGSSSPSVGAASH